jgi:hypothetical protein
MTLGELAQERQARASAEDRESAGSEAPRLGLMLAPAGKVAGAAQGAAVAGWPLPRHRSLGAVVEIYLPAARARMAAMNCAGV